jgi:DNA-binding GntR family transcriptional regulator
MSLLYSNDDPTKAEELYLRLKGELTTGAHMPGTKLSIRSLAESCGYGASPVREALKRLASERVLESGTKRSYIVPDLDDRRAVDLFNLRALLECEAAALALPRLGPPVLPGLRDAADAMAAAIERRRFDLYMENNLRFHFLIYERCANADMIAMIEQLWMQTGPSLHRGMLAANPDATWNRHHRALITAIEARDAEAIRREMLRDIGWGAEHYTRRPPRAQWGRRAAAVASDDEGTRQSLS